MAAENAKNAEPGTGTAVAGPAVDAGLHAEGNRNACGGQAVTTAEAQVVPIPPHGRRAVPWHDAWPLLAIAGLAILVRAVYLWQYGQTLLYAVPVGVDVTEYDAWAREILGGQLLWPQLRFHAPLYPVFLASLYWIFSPNLLIVRAVQSGMDVLSLLLVCTAVRLLWTRRAAVCAGLLWALYLPLVFYSAELVSEGLVVFLLSAALLLWALILRTPAPPSRRGTAWRALLGLCLGLAAVTHPLSLLFGAASLALVAWHSTQAATPPQAALTLGPFLAGLLLPILPVAWHNHRLSGEFVPIQARGTMNLYLGTNPDANGICYARPGPEYDRVVDMPLAAGITTESGRSRFYLDEAWRFVRTAPGQWLRLVGRKLVLTWNNHDIPSGSDLPEVQFLTGIQRLPLVRFGIAAALALAGLWFARRDRRAAPVALLIAAYALAPLLFPVCARYRLPMLPGLLAAAGLGLDGLVRAATHRHARNLATGLAVLMLGLALAFVPRPPPMPWTTTEFAELVAEAAWRQGRTETAVEWLGAGLTLEPRKPTLNHLMGRVLSDAELPARALPFYRTAVEQRPRDVPTRVGLARVLVMLGQKENARQELLAASLLNPDSPDVAYCLAVLEDDAGRSEQALALYRRALHFNPGFVRAHLKHANLCARRGLPDEARQHFLAALRLAPGNKAAMDGLARLSRIAVVSPAGAPAPAAPPHR